MWYVWTRDTFARLKADPMDQEYMDFIMDFQVDPDPTTPLDPRMATAVVALWKDPSRLKVMEHENEFYLMDSAPYFFEEAPRIGHHDYIPTEADVLRARTKTTGIYETRFSMGQLSIQCVYNRMG